MAAPGGPSQISHGRGISLYPSRVLSVSRLAPGTGEIEVEKHSRFCFCRTSCQVGTRLMLIKLAQINGYFCSMVSVIKGKLVPDLVGKVCGGILEEIMFESGSENIPR